MRRLTKLTVLTLMCVAFAAAGFAAPIYVQFSITSPTYPILGGGEFTGHIDTGSGFGPGINVFCDDFQNSINSSPFAAYISDATNYQTDTRFGGTASTSFAYLPSAGLSALDRYTMAAWLTTQYTYPTEPTANDLAIQTAIWTLLSQQGAKTIPAGADSAKVTYWLNQAVALKSNTPVFNVIQSELRIVTSADVITSANRYVSGQQEFIYLTPEPGSIVLAGLGLGALAFIRKRRQQH